MWRQVEEPAADNGGCVTVLVQELRIYGIQSEVRSRVEMYVVWDLDRLENLRRLLTGGQKSAG